MNMLLKQARSGQAALVSENRQTMSVEIAADPADPWSVTTNPEFSGRISHERSGPVDLAPGTAGLSTNLVRFLSLEHTVNFLVVGSVVTDQNGKQWKLGPVDPLEKFGGIYGYQIPLEEAV